MATVHVFVALGKFSSLKQLRAYIDETYTEDGDAVSSQFMREVNLSDYEPACIEAIHSKRVVPLARLLAGSSYGEQWLHQVDSDKKADAAICVYEPNQVRRPERCSLEYYGAFKYEP